MCLPPDSLCKRWIFQTSKSARFRAIRWLELHIIETAITDRTGALQELGSIMRRPSRRTAAAPIHFPSEKNIVSSTSFLQVPLTTPSKSQQRPFPSADEASPKAPHCIPPLIGPSISKGNVRLTGLQTEYDRQLDRSRSASADRWKPSISRTNSRLQKGTHINDHQLSNSEWNARRAWFHFYYSVLTCGCQRHWWTVSISSTTN